MNKLKAVVLALILTSCSTSSKYTGPVANDPIVSVTQMRHFVMDDPRLPQRIETVSTMNITNPSTAPMHVIIDCDDVHAGLDIKPRTTEHYLLGPRDRACTVTRD